MGDFNKLLLMAGKQIIADNDAFLLKISNIMYNID